MSETLMPSGSSPDSGLALPSSDLANLVRSKLLADLGRVRVSGYGRSAVYRDRAELLAECVTPETWVLVMDWLTSTRRASIATKRGYVDDIRTVWAPLAAGLGHERFALGLLTRDHVRTWRIACEAAGQAPRTIARRLRVLSGLHRYAADHWDNPPRSPVTRDDMPKVDSGRSSRSTPVLEVDELQRLTAAASTSFDVLVVTLLYTLAGRVSEMCAADVADLVERGRRLHLDLTRKENKERLLPLPPTVAELLDAHLAGRTDGPLLLDAHGERLDRHDVARLLTRLGHRARVLTCDQVGRAGHAYARCKRCRDVTPHVLRASRITHMLDDGVDLVEVQAFADHDNPATTVGYRERRRAGERNAVHVDTGAGVLADQTSKWVSAV